MNQYMIAFSSYYKAAYAQEELQQAGYRCEVGKTPPNLLKSCGYSLYMEAADIRNVLQLLSGRLISYRVVYRVDRMRGEYHYTPIEVR